MINLIEQNSGLFALIGLGLLGAFTCGLGYSMSNYDLFELGLAFIGGSFTGLLFFLILS
jgi:hypothetical protein